jgi:predicted small secreted protein
MLIIKQLIVFAFFIVLIACDTVAGIGKDITASADWSKQKITRSNKPIEEQKKSAAQGDTSSSSKEPVDISGPMK